MKPESPQMRTEKFLGRRMYCASNGGQAKVIKEIDGTRKNIAIGLKQGETMEGVAMNQEGLRVALRSPRIPLPAKTIGDLGLGLVHHDESEGNEGTYLLDPNSITGKWKVDRRSDPNTKEMGGKRAEEIVKEAWPRFRESDEWLGGVKIRDLTLQAVNKMLQSRWDEPIS